MGTEITVLATEKAIARATALVLALFAEWEETLSRFRPESELSRLNAAAGRPFRASWLLFRVVSRSLDAAEATGGLFDPTLLRDLERIGYDRTFSRLRPRPNGGRPQGGGGWRRVRIDRGERTIELPAGVGIDLGGIAKGLCVDASIALLERHRLGPVLVNAGGDLRALGAPPGGHWPVALGERETARLVPLAAGALATSGRVGRAWMQGAVERHHLLDPRTGEPASSGLRLVSVAAGTCGHAEVAAKAAFLLGPERGAAFLRAAGLAGFFVHDDGRTSNAGDWPAPARAAA
jgi:FAD:protein FMN transferase